MDSGRFDVVDLEVPEDPSEEDMQMIGLPPRTYKFDASMQLVPEASMQTLVLIAGADSRAQHVVERIAVSSRSPRPRGAPPRRWSKFSSASPSGFSLRVRSPMSCSQLFVFQMKPHLLQQKMLQLRVVRRSERHRTCGHTLSAVDCQIHFVAMMCLDGKI